ncbi:hypothetical protein QQF64_035914 [Cirrhinus molitorella]|uniref:Ubiquitin-like domain-containing protein n=1 Tax=Cirrhinus molitorella TaxID=172907 RepID=A0ABR3NHU7_9TELE
MSKLILSKNEKSIIKVAQAHLGFQPVGLVERIQAIAQNVSDMAIRMEQILKKTNIPDRVRLLYCGRVLSDCDCLSFIYMPRWSYRPSASPQRILCTRLRHKVDVS